MNILKLKNDIFKILIELFIFNKEQRMRVKSRWAKNHLKKYVNMAVSNIPQMTASSKTESNIIWQYWHQGEENAPDLIKKCLESVKRYNPDRKIIVLNYENIKDYIEIPTKYYDMVNNGKMRLAFFSDILRTYLLSEYGGTWIDSTIFLTGKIPQEIFESQFFVFSKNLQTDWMENRMSNFFIGVNCKVNRKCKTIECLKYALDKYWSENIFVLNYFMYEHIATLLSGTSLCKDEWNKMPYYSAEDTGILQKIIFEDFNQDKIDKIKQKTNIHKLSYKILRENTGGKSYYDKIISGKFV